MRYFIISADGTKFMDVPQGHSTAMEVIKHIRLLTGEELTMVPAPVR